MSESKLEIKNSYSSYTKNEIRSVLKTKEKSTKNLNKKEIELSDEIISQKKWISEQERELLKLIKSDKELEIDAKKLESDIAELKQQQENAIKAVQDSYAKSTNEFVRIDLAVKAAIKLNDTKKKELADANKLFEDTEVLSNEPKLTCHSNPEMIQTCKDLHLSIDNAIEKLSTIKEEKGTKENEATAAFNNLNELNVQLHNLKEKAISLESRDNLIKKSENDFNKNNNLLNDKVSNIKTQKEENHIHQQTLKKDIEAAIEKATTTQKTIDSLKEEEELLKLQIEVLNEVKQGLNTDINSESLLKSTMFDVFDSGITFPTNDELVTIVGVAN